MLRGYDDHGYGEARALMARLPEDPLIRLERKLIKTTERLGALVGAAVVARLKETAGMRRRLAGDAGVDLTADPSRYAEVSAAAIIGEPMQAMALAKLYAEYRTTLIEIEKLRLARSKQHLAERIAAAKLPAVDEQAIHSEIDRLIGERLRTISAAELGQLYAERSEEERLLREAESPAIGDPIRVEDT